MSLASRVVRERHGAGALNNCASCKGAPNGRDGVLSYGVRTEETGRNDVGRERITVWSGAFFATFEADGTARDGATFYTLFTYNGDRLRVKLPDGVTAPRTDENYRAIDDAIASRLAEHYRERGCVTVGRAA